MSAKAESKKTPLEPILVLGHSEAPERVLVDKSGKLGDYMVKVGATDVKLFHASRPDKPVAEANDSRVKVYTTGDKDGGEPLRASFLGTTDTVGEYKIVLPPGTLSAEEQREGGGFRVSPLARGYGLDGTFHWYPVPGRFVDYYALYDFKFEMRNGRGDMLCDEAMRMGLRHPNAGDDGAGGVDVEFFARNRQHLGDTLRTLIIATGLRVAAREREMEHRVPGAGRGAVDEAADVAIRLARRQAAAAASGEPAKTDSEHHHHHHHSHETKK